MANGTLNKADTRRFIRHPTSIPTECRKKGHVEVEINELRDISFGGMSFMSEQFYAPGDIVEVSFPVLRYNATVTGEVVWSNRVRDDGHTRFMNGMKFLDEHAFFHVRLTEQLCRIEAYRQAQEQEYGRKLTSREAAQEWIDRHATDFPK